MDNFSLGFQEVIPMLTSSDKWRDISLNTGGTQSMLQDIKLPERAGGFFYKDSSKYYTRNRFICWRIRHDTLEVAEHSLEVRLSGSQVRWRGGGALLGAALFEFPGHIVLLITSVCSVHRLVFSHPDVIHKQEKQMGKSHEDSSPSVLNEATTVQAVDPKNFYMISHYTNANSAVPHVCSMALNSNGEALFAIAGAGGNTASGILLVNLSPGGGAVTTVLRQESIVPRLLSAFRGTRNEGEVSCGLSFVMNQNGIKLYTLGRDAQLRVWCVERNSCIATHSLLSDFNDPVTQGPQNHMLRTGYTASGELLLGVYLCFSTNSRFTVLKPTVNEQNIVLFTQVCHLFGPEGDLVDFGICGNGIWAVWGCTNGSRDAIVTAASLGPTAHWRTAIAAPQPQPELLPQTDHQAYLEYLFRPGLFPLAVIAKALSIYERSGDTTANATRDQTIMDADMEDKSIQNLRTRTLAAAKAAEQRHAARTQLESEALVHKCWLELYSWCVQYLEGWRKPIGLVLSNQENGGWCLLLRRGGISFLRPLELLEHLLLSENASEISPKYCCPAISPDPAECKWVCIVIAAAGEVGQRLPDEVKMIVRAGLNEGRTPDHLIPQLAEDLLADGEDGSPPVFPPEVIASLARKLATVGNLPRALWTLNQALRLDCDDDTDEEENKRNDLETLFSSDLGISLSADTLYQMAQVRFSICCNLLILGAMLNGSTQNPWPGAGHTGVSLQAYNALCWLCETTLNDPDNQDSLKSSMERLSLLKLCSGELREAGLRLSSVVNKSAGIVWWFSRGAGGKAARRLLYQQGVPAHLHWTCTLHPYVHCLGHLLWGVSRGFTLGAWLAASGRPQLVKSYVELLAPWCEWNACSREFIMGMSYLDTGEFQRALSSFLRAGQGVTTETFLFNLLPHSSNQSTNSLLLNYYLKVIKLFELHKAPECIVSLAKKAIDIADKDDPHLSVFHSLVFRTWLELEQWEQALAAAGAHPDSEQRDNCVARLVAALGEKRCLPHLLAPGAPPPPPTTCRVAEQRARLCDEPYNHYYNFLYAYHIKCGDMRKAADVMYEQAGRISNELGPGIDALGRRARCLLAALNCLSLVPERHAFLVVSHFLPNGDKRDNRGEVVDRSDKEREVVVVGVEDLRKELHLVTARLKFAKMQPNLSCSEIGVEEVASLLSGIGLHAAAVSLRKRMNVPQAPALAALAATAAALPSLPLDAGLPETQADLEAWRWLAENDITELPINEKSASGAAWCLLKSLVDEASNGINNGKETRSSILYAVSNRLLSVGAFLPHWLLSEYKTADVASLIRLLTRHGRLSEAAAIGVEALRTSRPDPRPRTPYNPVCSPLPALDLLLAELEYQAEKGDDSYAQLYKELEENVKNHCDAVHRATENLKEIMIS